MTSPIAAENLLGDLFIDKETKDARAEGRREGRRRALAEITSLADPGVGPILEEGPTPWNVGLLALGVGSGFYGATVRMGRQIVGKIDDIIKKADSRWVYENTTLDQAAKLFELGGHSPSTARRLAETGHVPPGGMPQQTRRIRLDEVDPDAIDEVRKEAMKGDAEAAQWLEAYDDYRKGKTRYGMEMDTGDGWKYIDKEEKWTPGWITAWVDEGQKTMFVDFSNVDKVLQGKSIGTHGYMQLMNAAGAEGMTRFASDQTVSEAAQRVWKSLANRGVAVKVDLDSTIHKATGSVLAPSAGKPVFWIDLDKMYDPNAGKKFEAAMKVLADN